MIDRILSFSLRHRALVIGASVILAWLGIRAVHLTPLDAIPDLSENQVIVFSDWLGHDPPEVEERLTQPLMERLRGIAGVRTVRSSSDVNFSMIHVVFEDQVDVPTARLRVEERLRNGQDEFPTDARTYLAPEAPATGQIFWYTVEGSDTDLAQLRTIQDSYVKGQLASVDGVAEVASVGGFTREYQIELDPLRLAEHRVTLGQVMQALARAGHTAGGSVVHKAGQEFVVRSPNWMGIDDDGQFSLQRALADLRQVTVPNRDGALVSLEKIAVIATGPASRRGALEKDGNEVTGGVVMMRYGENPREVTRRLQEKIRQLRAGLPTGVRIVPGYDRTPLIEAAVGTVTRALIEAIITSVVCVLVVLLHLRSSLIIAVTLPLATLASFALLRLLHVVGWTDIPINIMSLSGLAISIGVLVDSSIVVTENVMHRLRDVHGDQLVTGETRPLVFDACRTVARPIFFSIMIMLVSFLPVLTIGGSAGKMFRPLAITKVFALGWVAVLAVTLVPVLASLLVKGRLRKEEDSWIVRSLIDVYRPLLQFLLDRPSALFWIVSVTLLLGFAPLGISWLVRGVLTLGVFAVGWSTTTARGRVIGVGTLLLVGLSTSWMKPLEHELNFITPLDEGTVMDMPITIPRVSLTQALDDLKARDMLLCRFPEVEMVMGKVGRAETPTDPAPVDMIETMVSLRPRAYWPRRKIERRDARLVAQRIAELAEREGLVAATSDRTARDAFLERLLDENLPRFDALLREYAYHRNHEFLDELQRETMRVTVQALVDVSPARVFRHRPDRNEVQAVASTLSLSLIPHHGAAPGAVELEELIQRAATEFESRRWIDHVDDLVTPPSTWLTTADRIVRDLLARPASDLTEQVQRRAAAQVEQRWHAHLTTLNRELIDRGAGTLVRLLVEEFLRQAPAQDAELVASLERMRAQRDNPPSTRRLVASHHAAAAAPLELNPLPPVDRLQTELTPWLAGQLILWRASRDDLGTFGGEMDQALQMPGWTNVWTRPIQNRVDMLNTGVGSTAVAIRVLGKSLEDVVGAGDTVAAALKELPGATNVIADPIRGKNFVEIHVDRERATAFGIDVADVQDAIQAATAGTVVGQTYEGRARHAIRVQFGRAWRADDDSLRNLPIPTRDGVVTLADVATVTTKEGPAAIKGENGLLRTYVRLDVRGRDATEFVQQARSVVARRVQLPAGVYLEWTGGFEYWEQSRRTLLLIAPVAVLLTLLLLYWTYRDLADALLLFLAVPGAIAGGLFLQWLWGVKFSMTVAIGYLSCFGMATSTAVIMLVYLREAVELAGGLERLTLAELRAAVVRGAVHRLRPKLLAEATTLIGLAPMLWATGVGAEVIGPMAVPVLGGILVADEVIDLFLPVMFYWVRRARWRKLRRHDVASPTHGSNDTVEPLPAQPLVT